MIIPPQTPLKSPPKFIVFEGVNGAGKSTLITRITDHLTAQSKPFVSTREPGSTSLGKVIRPIILEAAKNSICPLSEVFLFAADRAQHVERVIKPALAKGEVVLSDRYFYSTIAFQGYGRGLDKKMIVDVNEIAVANVYPDLVVLLDLDPAIGLKRIEDSRISPAATAQFGKDTTTRSPDAFEDENLDVQTQIRNGFLEIAKTRPEPFLVIDATLHPQAIFNQVREVIECA